MFLLLILLSCANDTTEAVVTMDTDVCTTCGHWVHIDSPPHAGGTLFDCWVWVHGNPMYSAGTYGGPVCLPMGD